MAARRRVSLSLPSVSRRTYSTQFISNISSMSSRSRMFGMTMCSHTCGGHTTSHTEQLIPETSFTSFLRQSLRIAICWGVRMVLDGLTCNLDLKPCQKQDTVVPEDDLACSLIDSGGAAAPIIAPFRTG